MSALVHEAGSVSGRTAVMLLTAAVHVALIAGLMATGIIRLPDAGPAPIKSWIQIEPRPDLLTPKPVTASRDWSPSNPSLPMPRELRFEEMRPETVIELPVEGTSTDTSQDGIVPKVPATAIGYVSARPTDAFYPPASIRASESGVVIVNVCISAGGALEPAPQVSSSSGYARLDGAALRWVHEGARFTPATRNGEAVADCKPMRVNFTLRTR